MGRKSLILEKELEGEDLRALADGIAALFDLEGGLPLDEAGKVKLSMRLGDAGSVAKLKIAYPRGTARVGAGGGHSGPGEAEVDYSRLKERMKRSFKSIGRSVADGLRPPDSVAREFSRDSALMVAFSGYGDEGYEAYTKAHEAFVAAWESGDVERLGAAVEALSACRAECHARFKGGGCGRWFPPVAMDVKTRFLWMAHARHESNVRFAGKFWRGAYFFVDCRFGAVKRECLSVSRNKDWRKKRLF